MQPQTGEMLLYAFCLMACASSSSALPLKQGNHHSSRAPVFVVTGGCSGSSWTGQVLRTILAEMGVATHGGGSKEDGKGGCKLSDQWESFKAKKNCYLERKDHDFVRETNAAVNAANKTLLAKLELSQLNDPRIYTALHDLGAMFVVMTRCNTLDKLICMVRDCFDDKIGFSTDEAGNRSHDCFARRTSAKKTLAYLDPGQIADAIYKEEKKMAIGACPHLSTNKSHAPVPQILKDAKYVQYEKLMAFEHGDIHTSAHAWSSVLLSLGHPFGSTQEAASALNRSHYANSRPPPESQSTSVYNWDEVRTAVVATRDQHIINMAR